MGDIVEREVIMKRAIAGDLLSILAIWEADMRDRGGSSNTRCANAFRSSIDRIEHLEALLVKAREALEVIDQRAKAYPVKAFPEPALDVVNAILKRHDMPEQMDRMHAAWAREIVGDFGSTAALALQEITQWA